MIIDLCHSWGQPPAWFWALPQVEQVHVLGWWRARGAKARHNRRPRTPAEEVAARVTEHRRELRDSVHATPSGAAYWLGKGG